MKKVKGMNRFSIFCVSSRIPKFILGLISRIYTGKRWRRVVIRGWHVGHRFGEFVKPKRTARYKFKSIQKKKKKENKKNKQLDIKIQKVIQIKSGLIRRSKVDILKKKKKPKVLF
jgi:ribosomal protein S19